MYFRHPPTCLPLLYFSVFCLSPEVKRKSHLHQAKLWWAALSVQKTWGFDSSHSMVINYLSTVVGPPLPFLSPSTLLLCCWWLEATPDKCCPYYWSHWEKGLGSTRLTAGQSHCVVTWGQGDMQDTCPFFTLKCIIERYCATSAVCDVGLNNLFCCSLFLSRPFPPGL